jgi:hypothetical protein
MRAKRVPEEEVAKRDAIWGGACLMRTRFGMKG